MTAETSVSIKSSTTDKVEVAVAKPPKGLLFDIHELATEPSAQSDTEQVVEEFGVLDAADPKGIPIWIDALFKSTVFKEQKRMAGRKPPSDDLVRKLLLAVEEQGGKLTSNVLSRKVDVPAFRLSTILAAIQRVLNVEGYSILTKDDASDSIEIDRELLCVQFGISSTDK
jgi:hypothetical protein